jgi:hypothetical protein
MVGKRLLTLGKAQDFAFWRHLFASLCHSGALACPSCNINADVEPAPIPPVAVTEADLARLAVKIVCGAAQAVGGPARGNLFTLLFVIQRDVQA